MFMHPIITISKYMKQKLTELQKEVGRFTTIIWDFTTPYSISDRTRRQ
jgi:hypothetical protein